MNEPVKRIKVKLEDGVWYWYERALVSSHPHTESGDPWHETWILMGTLNPQPGSLEGKA